MKIKQNLIIAAVVLGIIWAVFLVELVFPGLKSWGIIPRSIVGLRGLIFSPFLHGGLRHIMANSLPLFVLLLLSLSYNRLVAVEAIVIIMAGGGLGVWLFGAPGTVHIGASGVIFGLIGFLLFVGIFSRDIKGILIAVVVLFLYGGVILFGVVPRAGISWSGHVFGFLAGIVAAWLTGWANKGARAISE